MITKSIAENSHYRQEFYHVRLMGSDDMPVRCRQSGKCKLWKTRPNDFRLPVKWGLKTCFYITPQNANDWEMAEAYRSRARIRENINYLVAQNK